MSCRYSVIVIWLSVLYFAKSDSSVLSNSHNSYFINDGQKTGFLRVCYYSFGQPHPAKINGTLCTHIIKGFASILNGSLNPGTPQDVEYCIELANLKAVYPHLKVMLSIGGGGNDAGFSVAMKSFKSRSKLIHSVLDFLTAYNFDGLDVDWEFPVWNDGVKDDKPNLVKFLRDFRKISYFRHNRFYVLSVAVAAPKNIIDVAYDIPGIAKFVDFINLMSYDYHDYTLYTPFTGHNSPLFNRSVEHAYFATLNTAWSSLYWYEQGMPLRKIMVGLPTYAHTYKLLNSTIHGVDAPSTGFGVGNGTLTFDQVCLFLENGGVRVFDSESKVPYAYHNYDWVAYDDYSSIEIKAMWVKSKGFGGVMTFDLNCDDWQGLCNRNKKFPLHQIIYNILTKN